MPDLTPHMVEALHYAAAAVSRAHGDGGVAVAGSISGRTIDALESRGYVRTYIRGAGCRYRITDAGMAAYLAADRTTSSPVEDSSTIGGVPVQVPASAPSSAQTSDGAQEIPHENDRDRWSRIARETTIPDVLYAVSAAVMRHRQEQGQSTHWRVDLPTFYLDSRVQGIVSEDHAAQIVRRMLEDLGHPAEDLHVYACATLGPIESRKGI